MFPSTPIGTTAGRYVWSNHMPIDILELPILQLLGSWILGYDQQLSRLTVEYRVRIIHGYSHDEHSAKNICIRVLWICDGLPDEGVDVNTLYVWLFVAL